MEIYMSIATVSVYVRIANEHNLKSARSLELGSFLGGGIKHTEEPEDGAQYKIEVETSTTTGLGLIHLIEKASGKTLVKREGWNSTLQYFKSVKPFEKGEGVTFRQTAQELRNMGLPNVLDKGNGSYIWGDHTLEKTGVTGDGLVVGYTFFKYYH
jgi:hypothetical protein